MSGIIVDKKNCCDNYNGVCDISYTPAYKKRAKCHYCGKFIKIVNDCTMIDNNILSFNNPSYDKIYGNMLDRKKIITNILNTCVLNEKTTFFLMSMIGKFYMTSKQMEYYESIKNKYNSDGVYNSELENRNMTINKILMSNKANKLNDFEKNFLNNILNRPQLSDKQQLLYNKLSRLAN